MRSIVSAALLLGIAAPAAAAPAGWTVVPARSHIGFSGVYAGNPFKGDIGQWTAAIRFDPADLPASSANVTIASASARTGDKFQDTTLDGAEWFAPAQFPRITFAASKIVAAGPGRYVAQGTLMVKGKAVPVQLPFRVKIAGDTATMQGRTTLDRIALGLGTTSDPTGAWVSRPVALTIDITATRTK